MCSLGSHAPLYCLSCSTVKSSEHAWPWWFVSKFVPGLIFMGSTDCFEWAHPAKKTQGHPSHLLLGQLRSTLLSRRLLRGEFQSYCCKLVSSALLQSCSTGLMPSRTEGGTGRQRPGNWEERTDGIWRCWRCRGGWDSSDYGETEQTSVVPACWAVQYAPGHPNVLDRHARLPGRRCDGCSQAGSSSLPWRLHCTYLGLPSQYLN